MMKVMFLTWKNFLAANWMKFAFSHLLSATLECTHEGSGLSGTESRIRSTCKGATVEKGLAVQGKVAQTNRSSAKKAVQDWLFKLGK